MGKGSSSSQSNQQVDQRQVNTTTTYDTWNTTNNNTWDTRDDHSVSLGGGSLFAAGGSTINMTDGGAISGALDLATTLGRDAFKTTGGVVTDAFSFGSDLANYFGKAINANSGRAFDSVDTAVQAGAGLASKALNFADTSQSNAFDFGAQLAKLFGQQINASSGRAFDSVDTAVQALQAGNKTALSTVDSVTGNAFDFGGQLAKLFGQQINASSGRAFDSVDSATNAAIAATSKAATGAFDFADSLASRNTSFLTGVMAQQNEATKGITQLVANAYNDAKGRGAMTDTMMMVAIGGAVAVAIFALQRRG